MPLVITIVDYDSENHNSKKYPIKCTTFKKLIKH